MGKIERGYSGVRKLTLACRSYLAKRRKILKRVDNLFCVVGCERLIKFYNRHGRVWAPICGTPESFTRTTSWRGISFSIALFTHEERNTCSISGKHAWKSYYLRHKERYFIITAILFSEIFVRSFLLQIFRVVSRRHHFEGLRICGFTRVESFCNNLFAWKMWLSISFQ